MKRTMCFMIILGLALGTSLSACNLEAPCSVEGMYTPSNLSPDNWTTPFPDLYQQLSWSYPEECNPDSFIVKVGISISDTIYFAEVDGSERSVSMGPFENGTYYVWNVAAFNEGEVGGGVWGRFIIGSFCDEAERASFTAPLLLNPPDGQVVTRTGTQTFPDGSTSTFFNWCSEWQNTMSCLPSEGFTYEWSTDSEFNDLIGDTNHLLRTYECLYLTWPYPRPDVHDCSRIYWRVLVGEPVETESGRDYSGVSAFSEIRSFIINTSGTLCMPDFGLILTPFPWLDLPLPGGESTVTSATPPIATTLERANCRSGPALDYPILSILPAGMQFEIFGRNTDGDAWQVFDPELDDTCWVNADLMEAIGDTSLVEIVLPPPPPLVGPTDTPPFIVDCSQYNGALWRSCNLDPACYWDPSVPPNGECKNK